MLRVQETATFTEFYVGSRDPDFSPHGKHFTQLRHFLALCAILNGYSDNSIEGGFQRTYKRRNQPEGNRSLWIIPLGTREEILALKQQQRSQGQELAQASCDSGILKPPESLTDDKRKVSEKRKDKKES